jgi:hypothetical protein
MLLPECCALKRSIPQSSLKGALTLNLSQNVATGANSLSQKLAVWRAGAIMFSSRYPVKRALEVSRVLFREQKIFFEPS